MRAHEAKWQGISGSGSYKHVTRLYKYLILKY